MHLCNLAPAGVLRDILADIRPEFCSQFIITQDLEDVTSILGARLGDESATAALDEQLKPL